MDDATIARILPYAVVALAALCLGASLLAARRKLLIDNLPTSKTSGVFIGLVELKGRAASEAPLRSYLAGVQCVWYRYQVEEEWERTTTETYTDSAGREQTRDKKESGWTTVAKGGGGGEAFHLKDDRGEIRVWPKGASVEPQRVLGTTCHAGDPLYYGKGPQDAIGDSTGRRRFTEDAIPLGAPLFVVGHARQRADIVAAEIAEHKPAPLFLISTKAEEQVSRGYRWQFWGVALLGVALVGGGLYWREHILRPSEPARASTYTSAATWYVIAWLLGWIVMAFNSLIELRQRVAQGWANVDVELKRRADLIPNLVKLVAGMRDHESRVQSEVAALRAQAGATAPGHAGPDPAAVAGSVRAIAEAYPDLKANANFTKLQQQLVQTEERIALARSYFNEIATFYNTRLAVFPDGLVAALGGMRRRPLMEAAGFERHAVQVKLGDEHGAGPARG